MRKTCFTALTIIVRRLQSRFHRSARVDIDVIGGYSCEEKEALPEDVKEGCFAILAVKNERPMRFVVELSVLQNPEFLRLLKLAEEEYGFQHNGALAIPCRPEELKSILQEGIEGASKH